MRFQVFQLATLPIPIPGNPENNPGTFGDIYAPAGSLLIAIYPVLLLLVIRRKHSLDKTVFLDPDASYEDHSQGGGRGRFTSAPMSSLAMTRTSQLWESQASRFSMSSSGSLNMYEGGGYGAREMGGGLETVQLPTLAATGSFARFFDDISFKSATK